MKLAAKNRSVMGRSPNVLLQGFTLTEALIAITVMAVLTLLAVSVVGQARVRAMDAKCLWNIRATGAAAINYFTDHDGRFLPTKYWYSRLSTAASPGIRDYLGSSSTAKATSKEYHYDSVLTCPKLKKNHPRKFPCLLNRSYTMNRSLVTKEPAMPDLPDAPDNLSSPQRMVNVPNVARMWIFTDGSTSDPEGSSEFGTIASIATANNDQLTYPHQDRQNVVFLDGHVESLTKDEFKNPLSQREFWGDLTMAK